MSAVHHDTPAWYTRSQLPRGYTVSVAGTLDIGPYGRNGATALRFTGGADDYIECPCDGVWATVTSGAIWIEERDVRVSAYPASGQRKMLMACTDGATVQDGLYLEDDGTLSVCRGSGGGLTVLGTTTFILPVNTDYRVGAKVLIHASAGTADVQAQGPGDLVPVNVLAATGLDTLESGAAQWTHYRVGSGSPGFSIAENWVAKDGSGGIHDDLSTSPQNVVAVSRPIADVAGDSVPSSGIVRYAGIDDVTADDDVTCNELTTVGDLDIVRMSQPDPTKPIAAVLLTIVARAGGAGTEEIAGVIREGGVDTTGASHLVGATPRPYGEMYQESPSSPWSPAVYAALDGLGYERTA